MNWKQAISFALTSCGAMILFMGLFVVGPVVETKLFPVYSKFALVSVEPFGDGQSRAVFEFTKHRQCEPQGSAWFAGEFGAAFRQLPMRIDGRIAGTRPLGRQLTSPYIIDALPELVRDGVFAEIYSRCHPFWLTRSAIYP